MADVSVLEEASPRVYIDARRVSQSNAKLPFLFVCTCRPSSYKEMKLG
jgi:hypothetical protein